MTRNQIIIVGAGVAVVVVGLFAFISLGAYNIAADAPHSRLVQDLIEYARERSIEVRAAGIEVPNLDDPKRIAAGGAEYAEMCSSCHLAPGMERTEISQGLYPRAPELSRGIDLSAAEEFWVVKHGIKLTGMPAWGTTHDDELLWDVVAFLQKLPTLSAAEYQAIVKSAPESHEQMMHGDTMHEMKMEGGAGDKN